MAAKSVGYANKTRESDQQLDGHEPRPYVVAPLDPPLRPQRKAVPPTLSTTYVSVVFLFSFRRGRRRRRRRRRCRRRCCCRCCAAMIHRLIHSSFPSYAVAE